MPVAVAFTLTGSVGKWICLTWLFGVVALLQGFDRRAYAKVAVFSIDQYGIWDRRLTAKRITWQEIASISPCDTNRSHVVDLALRWPEVTLAGSRWLVRVGAGCQKGYGVPAVTSRSESADMADSSASDGVASNPRRPRRELEWSESSLKLEQTHHQT